MASLVGVIPGIFRQIRSAVPQRKSNGTNRRAENGMKEKGRIEARHVLPVGTVRYGRARASVSVCIASMVVSAPAV
jgi:hypothetical protein